MFIVSNQLEEFISIQMVYIAHAVISISHVLKFLCPPVWVET